MCMRLIRHRDYVIKISRMRSARPDPVCLQSATRVGWLTDTVVTVRELARWLIFFYGFFPVSPPPPDVIRLSSDRRIELRRVENGIIINRCYYPITSAGSRGMGALTRRTRYGLKLYCYCARVWGEGNTEQHESRVKYASGHTTE